MAAKFEISESKDGRFLFNLKAGNGEVILTSQLYEAKESAVTGIESVKTNAPEDDRYERKVAANEQHYFVLKAGNHQTIGKSELYTTTAAMEKGIASVKHNAPEARVEDLVS